MALTDTVFNIGEEFVDLREWRNVQLKRAAIDLKEYAKKMADAPMLFEIAVDPNTEEMAVRVSRAVKEEVIEADDEGLIDNDSDDE